MLDRGSIPLGTDGDIPHILDDSIRITAVDAIEFLDDTRACEVLVAEKQKGKK